MKIFIVDEETVNVKDLFKHYMLGTRFFCAKCNAEIVSAFARAEASKLKIAPGIYCPKNSNHVNIHFNIK